MSECPRGQIRWDRCDRSRAYTEAIKHHCPNATLLIDHFHLTKALNEAVDALRKAAWRVLAGAQRKAIMGLRGLLYWHLATRTTAQTRTCATPIAVFIAPECSRTRALSSGAQPTRGLQRRPCAPG